MDETEADKLIAGEKIGLMMVLDVDNWRRITVDKLFNKILFLDGFMELTEADGAG